jgi:predicted nucleic acid-binding protein
MPGEASYLVDTNVLLRLCKADDPQHGLVQAALDRLLSVGAALCYTSQNLAEF